MTSGERRKEELRPPRTPPNPIRIRYIHYNHYYYLPIKFEWSLMGFFIGFFVFINNYSLKIAIIL